ISTVTAHLRRLSPQQRYASLYVHDPTTSGHGTPKRARPPRGQRRGLVTWSSSIRSPRSSFCIRFSSRLAGRAARWSGVAVLLASRSRMDRPRLRRRAGARSLADVARSQIPLIPLLVVPLVTAVRPALHNVQRWLS